MLLLALLVIALLVTVQSIVPIFKVARLSGAEFVPPAKELSWETWMAMDYQRNLERRTAKEFGFRALAVRTYNQALYSLFGEHNPWVIHGKDRYLFEKGYGPAVCGEDFLGQEAIFSRVDSLVDLHERLKAKGKELIVVFPPNKWRYHKDKVEWPCEGSDMTNYEVFRGALKRTDILVMDWITGFQHMKSPHPLFTRQGTHWSIHGAALAGNLLNKVMGDMGLTEAQLELTSMEVADEPRNTDKDLHELLNILAKPRKETLAYPSFTSNGGDAPRAVIIGDSYYQSFYYLGLHQLMFAPESKYFYYNQTQFGAENKNGQSLDDETRLAEIEQSDVVILVMSEPSLKWFGYGILKLTLRQ